VLYCQKYTATDCFSGDFAHWVNAFNEEKTNIGTITRTKQYDFSIAIYYRIESIIVSKRKTKTNKTTKRRNASKQRTFILSFPTQRETIKPIFRGDTDEYIHLKIV